MYVIREVLNCKPGKVRQMVEKFRSISTVLKEMGQEPLRVLTDVTGEPYWTIVAEARVEKSELSGLVVTDSIASGEGEVAGGKIRRLSIAPLLGEAIKRISEEASVSSLFD